MGGFSPEFGGGFDTVDSPVDGEFSCQFSDEFALGCEPLVTIAPIGLAQAERPKHPPYSRLWRKFAYPLTPAAVLLWQTGEVKALGAMTDEWLTADDIIMGGHQWSTPRSSWQAQVLRAAGFTLIPLDEISGSNPGGTPMPPDGEDVLT